jgi:hypothetical protein
MIVFALPETLKSTKNLAEIAQNEAPLSTGMSMRPSLSRTSTREAVRQRSRKYATFARMLFLDPLKVIVYLKYPAVLLSIYYASVTFGSLYVLNISVTYTFEKQPYGYSTLIVGLLYIPNSVGYIISSIVGGRWMDYIMKREAIKARRTSQDGKLVYLPEDRMRENAWLGAVIYPAALIWYGWTAEKGIFWLVPVSHSQTSSLNLECRMLQGTNLLTRGCGTDDCKLLLRCRVDAHFCHGDYNVDRIHAQAVQFWGGTEQLDSEHLLMYWQCCWRAVD